MHNDRLEDGRDSCPSNTTTTTTTTASASAITNASVSMSPLAASFPVRFSALEPRRYWNISSCAQTRAMVTAAPNTPHVGFSQTGSRRGSIAFSDAVTPNTSFGSFESIPTTHALHRSYTLGMARRSARDAARTLQGSALSRRPHAEARPLPRSGGEFVDQLHAALFPSESDLDASAPAAASDLQAITAQAAARMEAVQALVQRTRARQPRGMLLGDEVHAAVGAVEKLHRYVTKLLAAVHLCGGPDARGAHSFPVAAHEDQSGSDSCGDSTNDATLQTPTIPPPPPPAAAAAPDCNAESTPTHGACGVQGEDGSAVETERGAHQVDSEEKHTTPNDHESDEDSSDVDAEACGVGGAFIASVSFKPVISTNLAEVASTDGRGTPSTHSHRTATPILPPAHFTGSPDHECGQELHALHHDPHSDAVIVPFVPSTGAMELSIPAARQSSTSMPSSTSQIKTEGLTRMERSRRSKLLSGKRWPYKLGNVIGAGAHGVVYLALMEDTGETVAAKQVLFSTDDPAWEAKVKSLQTEISVLRRIEHENVVGYLFTDRVQRNGMAGVLVFMEFVSGGSLANLIHHFGALPEKTAAIFVAQMLLGLRHLHDNGIVCRDVKNSNVLLSPFGVAKLADFATALLLEDDAAAMASSCGAEGGRAGGGGGGGSGLVGTPLFMSPEAIRSERVTWSTDIWSLGASVMEMVTGRPPWDHLGLGGNAVALLHRVAADDEPLPLPPNLTPLCTDFLAQCLRKDPAARPTCSQLLRHPWFEVHDVLMLSFDRSCAIGNLQIRPDVIENIGVQLSDSTSQRPVNQLAASMSVMSLSEPVQRKPLR